MKTILVDTGAVFALFDQSSRKHGEAKRILMFIARKRYKPLLTNFLVAEIYALLLTKAGSYYARKWLKNNSWPVERVLKFDECRAKDILFKYDDKEFSYTDAVSFAVMERLQIETAFTFDKHFQQYGFRVFRLEDL
jgi:predicted nucleic acid-binding protein